MVFQVPEWDDNSPTQKSVTKTKESFNGRKQKSSSKIAPTKARQKKNAGNVNKISDASKLINKENKRIRNNKIDHSISNIKEKPQKNGQVNGVANTSSPNETNKKKTKLKGKKNNDIGDNSIKVDNIDVEKLDEAILNAKKKKFNEALIRDDVEDLLFCEKSPETNRRPSPNTKSEKTKKNNVLNGHTNSLVKDGKNKNKMEQKTLNNKIVKAKNIGVKPNNTAINDVKQNKLVKAKNNGNINISESADTEMSREHSVNDNTEGKLKPYDRKKEKVKKMLEVENIRNPINFNRNKLRERMLDRLKSAQFRFLNEKLYTSSATEAGELFRSDPAAFSTYHEGYQQQVRKWPVNPLDVIVKRILKMPKSHKIADMGCGEAALATRVPHAVRSFDLVASAPRVEACDMARTPLLAESMDATVYCLALMGTDLTQYLVEANRVLKTGGLLLIAEVESRFSDVDAFTQAVQKLGFKLKSLDRSHEVFFYMEFAKVTSAPHKKAKQPDITLKPCLYKRR